MKKQDEIEFRNIIAENVLYYRNVNNLSQYQLSIDAEITRNQIGRIERSEINTTAFTLLKISKALEIDISQLIKKRIKK